MRQISSLICPIFYKMLLIAIFYYHFLTLKLLFSRFLFQLLSVYHHVLKIYVRILKFPRVARSANQWNKLLNLLTLALKGASPPDFRKIFNFHCLYLWSSLSAGSVKSISLMLFYMNRLKKKLLSTSFFVLWLLTLSHVKML